MQCTRGKLTSYIRVNEFEICINLCEGVSTVSKIYLMIFFSNM